MSIPHHLTTNSLMSLMKVLGYSAFVHLPEIGFYLNNLLIDLSSTHWAKLCCDRLRGCVKDVNIFTNEVEYGSHFDCNEIMFTRFQPIDLRVYVFLFILLALASKSLTDVASLDSMLATEWTYLGLIHVVLKRH